ncbi:MAG: hypothetical protein AAFP19_16380 [Bacteroidota bacterium]
MFKYTKHTLKKIEDLFKAVDYTIRYERGNFQSGYCIVENRNIAVINKFYDTEARINCLLEILPTVEVRENILDEKMAAFYKKLIKFSADSSTNEVEEQTTE